MNYIVLVASTRQFLYGQSDVIGRPLVIGWRRLHQQCAESSLEDMWVP